MLSVIRNNQRTTVSISKHILKSFQSLIGRGNTGKAIDEILAERVKTEKRRQAFSAGQELLKKHGSVSIHKVIKSYKHGRK